MKLSDLLEIVRLFGFRRTMLRLQHEVKQRTGYYRKAYPFSTWASVAAPQTEKGLESFHFDWTHSNYLLFAKDHNIALIADADRILAGGMSYFSHLWVDDFQGGDQWYTNPINGEMVDPTVHWQDQSFVSREFGDMKVIVDPSRFGWVYTLMRAYRLTEDPRYALRCRALFKDWCAHARPFGGPLWVCGQETALRAMAIYFMHLTYPWGTDDDDDFGCDVQQSLAAHGQRIEGSMAYALSQKNNHGITEAAALYAIGHTCHEDPRFKRWLKLGRESLIKELRGQIYDDGAYVQHSVNYHRVMLQAAVWGMSLAESNSVPFPEDIYDKVGKAARWLWTLVEPENGHAPNYGSNDGAWIFPLDECGYHDYRSTVQAAFRLCFKRPAYPAGPWDEPLYWFFPCEPSWDNPEPEPWETTAAIHFPKGGNIVLRAPKGRVIAKCADYTDRPGQADQLHVDVWHQGHPIAVDAGTYCYNAVDEWANGLARSDVHNTLTLDGQDQMKRLTRFTWSHWGRGQVTHNAAMPDGSHLLTMQHDAYMRFDKGAVHHRAVLRLDDKGSLWAVIDHMKCRRTHAVRLHWLFPDYPFEFDPETNQLRLETPAGYYHVAVASATGNKADLVRADAESRRGWYAPHYGSKEPGLSLALTSHSNEPVMVTLFSAEPAEIELDGSGLTLHVGGRSAKIDLAVFRS